jgi:hypothetical protein
VYELFSWKAQKVHTDDQGLYLKKVFDELDNVVVLVGDPAGKQDDFEVWRTRLNLPIDEANKKGKNTLEEFLADDIRRGRVHLRHDSPLYDEMKHLRVPADEARQDARGREVPSCADGIVHGDHCCDAARYAYEALTHYLSQDSAGDGPEKGTIEALQAEEVEVREALDEREKMHARSSPKATSCS